MILTVICFVCVALGALVLAPIGLIAFVLSLLGLKKSMRIVTYRAAQAWALFLMKLTGCKLSVSGRENIPRSGGLCFASNHSGIFDVVLLLAFSGRPFGFIAKKELARLPILNLWILWLGGLYIDRKNLRKGFVTINKGISRIKSGGAMVIFPEGRRSRGQGLLPFHPGALKLATQAQAPIVPVAISGSHELFEKTRRVSPCPIKISFGKPLNTADIPIADRKHLLTEQVFHEIKGMLENQN
jgi:1-acyl-sn-glycerol-3-phosphate acyltransferase